MTEHKVEELLAIAREFGGTGLDAPFRLILEEHNKVQSELAGERAEKERMYRSHAELLVKYGDKNLELELANRKLAEREGYATVPVEPTSAMYEAAKKTQYYKGMQGWLPKLYKAMIAAGRIENE